jgi:hypothetical protein
MKIRPTGCSMRTDGRTERHDETDSRFSQFWNAPKNLDLKETKDF